MHNTRMILFRLFYKKYHRSIIEVSQITSLNSALSRFKRLKKKCLLFQFDSTFANGEVKEVITPFGR